MSDRASPASVRQRLLNRAKEAGVEFEYMLVRYANERFLYRLSQSRYRDGYILKGAMLFATWTRTPHRPTRDIDLLGYGTPASDRLRREFQAICAQDVEPDGLVFDARSVQVEVIRQGQLYEGVRITMLAGLGEARIPVQVDVGFGDATEPGVDERELPTLLEFPPPRLRAYRPETVVAEKFEAMVRLGIANTRMKDFYDLYVMSRAMTFDCDIVGSAIRATFARRGTTLPARVPTAPTERFARDRAKQAQWRGFAKRTGAEAAEIGLSTVIEGIRALLLPAVAAARRAPTPKAGSPDSGRRPPQR